MKYVIIPPPPTLSKYVRYFWVLRGTASPRFPYFHRKMADGCTELLFHFKGRFNELFEHKIETSFNSGFHGQSFGYRSFSTNEPFGILGAYLYPFALHAFFSIPAAELTNQMVSLSNVISIKGVELEEKILSAKSQSEMVSILTVFLEDALQRNSKNGHQLYPAVDCVIQNKGMLSINSLSEYFCLSTRQFERKFKEISGLSPKLFSRIIRFQSSVEEYGKNLKSLAEIAFKYGYYDQSHFIQDFRQFSGHNPKEFFKGKAEGMDWMKKRCRFFPIFSRSGCIHLQC